MSVHTTIQYLRYRLRARTRHGIHSPFVYAFIEQVLHNTPVVPANEPATTQGDRTLLPARYHHLLWHIERYCNPSAMRIIPVNDVPDLISKKLSFLDNADVVILPNIHTTPAHTAAWVILHSNTHVKLSIDLYGMGLLFFRKEFKEKQHFVLKY